MYDPPDYLWAIIIAGITAIPLAACFVLYDGARRSGLSRARAALLAGGAALVLGVQRLAGLRAAPGML